MSSNAPPFDPLNPTPEESDAMFEGYRAATRGDQKPPLASQAFEHGYRMGRNDKARVADDDQRELARRIYDGLIRAGEVFVLHKTQNVGKTEDLVRLIPPQRVRLAPARRAPG